VEVVAMPYPNTTKEEIEEYDRKVKENVKKYYQDRMWRVLGENLRKEAERHKINQHIENREVTE